MRRGLRLPGLSVALVVGVLESGTLAAQVLDAPSMPGTHLRPSSPHYVGSLYAVEASF
jgi:hypothetical protein